MKLGTLVHVTWVDSYTTMGWRDAQESGREAGNYETIGWLSNETDTSITVAGSQKFDFGHYNCQMTIPKCAVKKVRRVKL